MVASRSMCKVCGSTTLTTRQLSNCLAMASWKPAEEATSKMPSESLTGIMSRGLPDISCSNLAACLEPRNAVSITRRCEGSLCVPANLDHAWPSAAANIWRPHLRSSGLCPLDSAAERWRAAVCVIGSVYKLCFPSGQERQGNSCTMGFCVSLLPSQAALRHCFSRQAVDMGAFMSGADDVWQAKWPCASTA